MENQQKRKFENGVIYKITNPNGHIYVGQTINYKERIKKYKTKQKINTPIHKSILKYGFENHTFEIIISGINSKEELDKKEIYFISFFDSYKNGLNCTTGGDIGTFGYVHTESTRKKLSENKIKIGNVHPWTKKVYQYSSDFVFIREFDSLSDAEKSINKTPISNGIITNKLNKKTVIKAKGFYWTLDKNITEEEMKSFFIKEPRKKKYINKINPQKPNALKVILITKNKEQIFETLNSFCLEFSIKISSIFDRINGYPAKKFPFEILYYSKKEKLLRVQKKVY
jgi:group I intron endonuclease